jgi:hypothetical protein
MVQDDDASIYSDDNNIGPASCVDCNEISSHASENSFFSAHRKFGVEEEKDDRIKRMVYVYSSLASVFAG